ncbi:hypothetical protein AB0A05_27005 [Streptomyces sp. NPDC046374]|uniref:Thoeris anti-defense Tad2 family protein n=1 Tax=Streptomyces sp. NPDC046374 TaxID=3154917 RepID=UPI00340F0E1B
MSTDQSPDLPPLMTFGQIEPHFLAGAEIARAGWARAGKCWKHEPAGTDDQGRPRAETILQRYETGEWGPPELTPRSLLAKDWFVGVSGRERPTAPLPPAPRHEEERRRTLQDDWLAIAAELDEPTAQAVRRTSANVVQHNSLHLTAQSPEDADLLRAAAGPILEALSMYRLDVGAFYVTLPA